MHVGTQHAIQTGKDTHLSVKKGTRYFPAYTHQDPEQHADVLGSSQAGYDSSLPELKGPLWQQVERQQGHLLGGKAAPAASAAATSGNDC